MKNIFIVRHCKAEGQDPAAELTIEGVNQASQLAEYLKNQDIDCILTSPYKRALDTVAPLSNMLNLNCSIDKRLEERILSSKHLDNWMELLRNTYIDMDIVYEGGESSREAMNRAIEVIKEVLESEYKNVVVVTHGALMSLILNFFDNSFGYENWSQLTNPDIYLLRIENNDCHIKRVWE